MAGGAVRGGGRGRGRPPSATRAGGRGRERPPKKTGLGRPPKKAVNKKVPVKPTESKTSAGQNKKRVQLKSDLVTATDRNESEKSVRGKRKSAVNNPPVNVARQEELDSQNRPPSKKRKLEPTTPVASPSPSQNKKVSAKVEEEDKEKKKTCSHYSFKKCPWNFLNVFGYEKETKASHLPPYVRTMKIEAMTDVSPFKASNREVESKLIQNTQEKVTVDEIEVEKNCSIATVAKIHDVTVSKDDNVMASKEHIQGIFNIATEETNITENDCASDSKVEDAFTSDTAFLENNDGNSSCSTTVPQDNKVPVTPAQGSMDFRLTGFKNPSCTVSRVQYSKLGGNGTHQMQTNASHGGADIEDTIQVSQVQNISNNNTTVPIRNENNAAASQVDDIDTSKVFKASTIHGRKKLPYVCATCSKHYFRKDQFLGHIVDHTRERLRNVKPKRQHKKKCVSFALSDPVDLVDLVDLVGPSSLVKTINSKEGNLPENGKNLVNTKSDQENFPDGNNVDILYDKTGMGTTNKLDATINLSDDEDMSTPSISDEGDLDLISSPTLLANSNALSASPTRTNRTNPSFGNKISKVNRLENAPIYVLDDTIHVSDDEEPTNSKELKCTKKIMKKRHFTYQPLRQNQIPNGGYETETEDNSGPINHDLPKLNMDRESGVKSRSSCGKALDKLKLLGPAISLFRTTSPCDTSRTKEKEAADMRLKETENTVKSAKVGLPRKRATPPSMRETGDTVKRLKVLASNEGGVPPHKQTNGTEVTETIRKRINVCFPQSRPSPASDITTDFEDET